MLPTYSTPARVFSLGTVLSSVTAQAPASSPTMMPSPNFTPAGAALVARTRVAAIDASVPPTMSTPTSWFSSTGEHNATIERVSAGFEGVKPDVTPIDMGASPADRRRRADSVTLPAAPSAVVTDAAPGTLPTTSAPMATPAASPRQALVATLTAAHATGDLATAQIAARTLSELLSAPQTPAHVAPVVDLASARRARS